MVVIHPVQVPKVRSFNLNRTTTRRYPGCAYGLDHGDQHTDGGDNTAYGEQHLMDRASVLRFGYIFVVESVSAMRGVDTLRDSKCNCNGEDEQ